MAVFRVLNTVHDVGLNFAVSSSVPPSSSDVIVSLDSSTGATVQGALSVSNNASVGGSLVVGTTNVLDAITAAAASGGDTTLDSSSDVQVASIAASLVKA